MNKTQYRENDCNVAIKIEELREIIEQLGIEDAVEEQIEDIDAAEAEAAAAGERRGWGGRRARRRARAHRRRRARDLASGSKFGQVSLRAA